MKTYKHDKLILWIAYIMLFFAVYCLGSCRTLTKVFNKQKEKTDSTSVTKVVTDSSSKKDSVAVHKDTELSTNTFTIEFDDNGIYVPVDSSTLEDWKIYRTVEPEDYLVIDPILGTIKTNKKVKKVTYTGTMFRSNFDSVAASEVVAKSSQLENSASVKKESKVVSKDKKVTGANPWFWIILISAGAIWLAFWVRRKSRLV
jgi:hypothetical protein